MPKSKVRKKTAYTQPRSTSGGTGAAPGKVAGPSHPVYVAVMMGLMLMGLIWLVVNYLAGEKIGFMVQLGSWNFLIGFGLIVVGLFMTMRWR